MEINTKKTKSILRDFWEKYETKTVLAIGLILVAILSFEMGTLQGQNWKQKPLIIERPIEAIDTPEKAESTLETQNLASGSMSGGAVINSGVEQNSANLTGAECVFVGSKNSDKYHLPSCTWAKRIKPENIVCFKSTEDAKSKGYIPDSCLNK